jgi:hypothetical protein
MSKFDKMIQCLRAQDISLTQDIIEALTAAKVMRESVSLVRVVGKTIVEVREEAAFVSAASDFSYLTD